MALSGSTSAGPNPAGSVSFKAYLAKKGSDKPMEVRRFGVEQNEVTSFELLKAKLRQVFPNLSGQEFTVGWKDFENDEIIISSNDELITFLTETNDQVRRLYLTINNPISVTIKPHFFDWNPVESVAAALATNDDNDSDEDDEEDSDVQLTTSGCKRPWHSSLKSSNLKFHPHVYCDGCQKQIPGHRYKCLECPDFDLCIDCESQNTHKEHVMLRIPLTMSHYPKLNNFAKGMHHMSEALRKIDHRIKKQERRMHKMCDLATPFFADHLDMIPHSKRCKRDDKEKDKKDKDEKRDKRDKREKRDRKEKECSSSASAGCSAEAAGSASAKAGCPFPSGLLSSFLNPQTLGNLLSPQNLNTLQQIFEHMSPVPEQLLQEVAQNLADVRLSDPAAPAPAASGSSTPTNPFSVPTKKPSAPEADGAVPSTSSTNQSPVAARKGAESQGAEKQAAPQAAAQTEGSPSASASANAVGRPNASASASASGSSTPVSGRSSRSSSEEADPEGWTVVDAHLKDASGEQASVYPKLPASEPTPQQPAPAVAQPREPMPLPILHRDPEVQKCLRALAEMGFDVHQQMIVQLAVEYKGNVGRVLSALVP